MSATTAKWISSIVLFLATVAVSVLPVMLFNYYANRKNKKHTSYSIRRTDTFNISSSSNAQTSRNTTTNLSTASDDNDSITGSGENVIRRTRSNSIGSIASISSRKLNKRSAAILQMFMFFGGGVLLATCFCHLLPEIKENFENYMIKNNYSVGHSHHHHIAHPLSSASIEDSTEFNNDFANYETTLSPGLLSVHTRNLSDLPIPSRLHAGEPHNHNHDHEEDEHDHDHDHESESTHEEHVHQHNHGIPWVEVAVCAGFFFIYFLEEIVHTFVHNHKHGFDEHNTTYKSESIDEIRWDLPYQSGKTDSDTHLVNNTSNKPLPCYDNYAIDFNSEPQLAKEQANKKKSLDQDSTIEHHTIQTKHLSRESKLLPASVRFVQGLVTIMAFSAHSIFDGLAIGLRNSPNQVYTMLFAISMHKLVVAFAVGLELFDQTSSVLMTAIHMSLFSIMSPIGIWIVIFSQMTKGPSEDQSLLLIILSAIATGTIIYIVFFEILQKDRSGSNVNGLLLWFIMISGFVLMLSVNIFVSG